MATVAATPSQLLARQRETLSELRAAAETDTTQLVDVLRAELASRQEEARTMSAAIKAAEKREAAAVVEAVNLRTQVAQVQAEATATARRTLWDHRKREEVAAAAAASAAAAAAQTEQQVRSELARVSAALEQRERELSGARAQLRAMRDRKQEESLQERTAEWLREEPAGAESKGKSPSGQRQRPRKAEGAAEATVLVHNSQEAQEPARKRAMDELAPLQEGFIERVLRGGR